MFKKYMVYNMADIITVNNLVEIYADGTKAVDDISFSVDEGEFFGFLARAHVCIPEFAL